MKAPAESPSSFAYCDLIALLMLSHLKHYGFLEFRIIDRMFRRVSARECTCPRSCVCIRGSHRFFLGASDRMLRRASARTHVPMLMRSHRQVPLPALSGLKVVFSVFGVRNLKRKMATNQVAIGPISAILRAQGAAFSGYMLPPPSWPQEKPKIGGCQMPV